jgi:hypothetical protein
MSKVTMLTAILALGVGAGGNGMDRGMLPKPSGCETITSASEAAQQTFFFAFPLYEMWRTRQRMLSQPGAQINRLIHRKTLSQPADRSVTMPNVDTLYSTAWLDLADGPVRFSIPDMGSRYHSVELMHVFSDAFAILRNDGQGTRHFLIVGPDWDGASRRGEIIIRSPTRDAWLVARTFVERADDLDEAQRLQGEYRIEGIAYALGKVETAIPERPNGNQFLEVVNTVLGRGSLPPQQAERLGCLGQTKAWRGDASIAQQIDPAMGREFDRHIADLFGETILAFEHSGNLRKGWRYPQPNIAQFGSDDLYRSAIALGGLAALPVSEAINSMTVHDADGAPLDGSGRYQITIPANVPVDAFWSLTLYESDGAGRWFLYDNPIDRHAVNSMANEIRREPDGTILLEISHDRPIAPANWLPAPKGRFLLLFRAYRPAPRFLDGSFALPAVKRVAG